MIHSSGNIQVLPEAIVTCKYNQLIEFYQSFCKESDYQPLSESTLWKILHTIKPSQQNLLVGLDDIVADAMNGFKILKDGASYFQDKALVDSRVQFNNLWFVFHESSWSFHEPYFSRKHIFYES